MPGRRPRCLAALFVLSVSLPLRAAPQEREVVFDGAGGAKLAGTLTLPQGVSREAPVAAVVLVAGSGPTNRDGNQPPLLWSGLLKQTADLLADAGIASLRYDKRGQYRSSRPPQDRSALPQFFSWENHVADVVAACAAARAQPEVDASRIALVGHSEGGLLVIEAALALRDARRPPAAVVLLSTPGRRTDVILREQMAAVCRRLGVTDAGAKRLLERNDAAVAQIRETGTVPDDLPPDLKPLYPWYVGPFLQSQFKLDPAAVAARLKCPVLVVQGEKDLQVSAERDAHALGAALKRRPGDVRSDVVILRGASHNLKHVEQDGEHGIFGPTVPEFRVRLTAWLREVLRVKEAPTE